MMSFHDNVFLCGACKRFHEVREEVENNRRPGSSKIDNNISKINDTLQKYWQCAFE